MIKNINVEDTVIMLSNDYIANKEALKLFAIKKQDIKKESEKEISEQTRKEKEVTEKAEEEKENKEKKENTITEKEMINRHLLIIHHLKKNISMTVHSITLNF